MSERGLITLCAVVERSDHNCGDGLVSVIVLVTAVVAEDRGNVYGDPHERQ